ncbi:MAG: hypothetical protein ACRDHJ_00625 [Actinomycetota bacterium]
MKQDAGAVEDIRFVFEEESPTAVLVAEGRLLAEELRRAAEGASGMAHELLLVEAGARARAAEVLLSGSAISADPRYEDRRPAGSTWCCAWGTTGGSFPSSWRSTPSPPRPRDRG